MSDYISASQFQAAEGTEDWRVISDGATAYFRTGSFSTGARFAAAVAELEGVDAHPPDIDIRPDGVTVRIVTMAADWMGMSQRDVELARRISALAREHHLVSDPTVVQSLLIIPGAASIGDITPFWRAVLGYEPRIDSPEADLVDPRNRGAAFWFETMDEPRDTAHGGGAIHVGIWVPVGQGEARVAAALAAGGHIVRDDFAPSWWTLADSAGNEADIGTIEGRD